jgi:hypothetical protein
MSDKGFWTFYRRGMRQASRNMAYLQTHCHKCGHKQANGLIDGLCDSCFCAKLDAAKLDSADLSAALG